MGLNCIQETIPPKDGTPTKNCICTGGMKWSCNGHKVWYHYYLDKTCNECSTPGVSCNDKQMNYCAMITGGPDCSYPHSGDLYGCDCERLNATHSVRQTFNDPPQEACGAPSPGPNTCAQCPYKEELGRAQYNNVWYDCEEEYYFDHNHLSSIVAEDTCRCGNCEDM